LLLTAIILYLALTVAVGAWASSLVKSSNDFVLAGRSLPFFLSASALFATWFGSETMFGASSVFLEEGLQGVIEDPFGGALCLILFGTFYLRPMYRMGVLTIGDVFKKIFGDKSKDEIVNFLYKDTIASSTKIDLQFFILLYFISIRCGENIFLEKILDDGFI
jgi:Na+/proline symporter